MFDKIFGALRLRPANDQSGLEPTGKYHLEAAIDRCVKPEGQGLIRAIFLTGAGGDCLDQGDYDGAIQQFEAALEVSPGGWQAGNTHVMLGITHHHCCRYEAALRAFTRGLELGCTSHNEAYRRRSFAQAALGDFSAALADMRRSAAEGEDPAFVAAKFCALHLVMGNPEAALAAVLETAETQAGDIHYRLEQMQSRAEVRLLMGDRAGATADLDLEAILAEGDSNVMALWRYTLRRRAGLAAMTPAIETQMESNEDPGPKYMLLWFETADSEARDRAIARVESCLSMDDRMTALCESHYRLGAVAEYVGDRDAARRHYTFAAAHPETAWCIEYALAQYGLRRLE